MMLQSAFRGFLAALLLAFPAIEVGAAEAARLFSADDGAVPLRQAPKRLLRADSFPEGGGLGAAAGGAGELELRGGGLALGGAASSAALRSRVAEVDLGQLELARLGVAGRRPVRLGLNLFADAAFDAVFERSAPTASGYTLTGRLEGDPLSAAVLAVNGEWVAGTVWSQRGRYVIRPLGGGVAEVRQADASSRGRCGVGEALAEGARDALPPAAAGRRDARRPFAVASAGPASGPDAFPEDDGSVIDLLVVYPSFGRRSAGGHLAMRALIDSDVALANEAYRAGGAELRLNLAAAVEARRTALEVREGGMSEALRHASDPSSGYMDEVHALRDSYAADLVLVHWGHLIEDEIAGVAYLLASPSPEQDERHAFGVANSFAFAHELGHNMGLRHHRANDPENTPFPYSHGHAVFDSEDFLRFSTIMAAFGPRTEFGPHPVPRFSNPRQWYSDESGVRTDIRMGVSGDAPSDGADGPADAVRSLNGTRRVAANFRRSASRCRYALSPPDSLPASGGEFRIGVRADSGCAWSAFSNDQFVSVADGSSGAGDGEVVFRLSANAGWERQLAVFVAGEAYLAEQATAKERRETSVCDRAPPVRWPLVWALGKPCGEIGAVDLAAIRTLAPWSFLPSVEPEERRLAPGDFDGLTGLVSLDLSWMDLHGWAPGTFDGLIRLVSLDLRNNAFAELAAGAFDGLPNLVELKLEDNRLLTTLAPSAFRGLPNVHELWLKGTGLTALPAGAFEGLSNLDSLDLSAAGYCGPPDWDECIFVPVPVAKIEPGAFRGLSKLRSLIVHGDSLTVLRLGTFDGLHELRELSIFGRAVKPGTFAGLSKLRELRLYGDSLTTLEPGTFAGLSKLRYLYLSRDSLTPLESGPLLEPGTFAGLSKLRYLYLNRNSLTTLEPGTFAGLAELDGLELSENQLKTLEPGAFRGLPALTQLILGRNQLRNLEPGVFDGLARLKWVYLADNDLKTLKPALFDGLTALRTVTLNSNELTDLDPALFQGTLNQYGRSQMQALLLADNRLTTLNPDLLRGMIRLQRLKLSANRFAKLPPGLFEGLHNLSKLELRDNPGAPFAFVPELVRRSGAGSAPGGTARITAEVAQGAPFDMRIALSAIGGSLSAREVLIRTGAVRGRAVSVIPRGSGPVTVLAAAPDLPPRCEEWEFKAAHSDPCLYGLKTASGAPLVLHGLPDQTLAPGGAVRFDLPTAFPNFGAGTSYAVESSNPAAFEVLIREGLLIVSVSAAAGGETILTVTATGSDGRRETRRFAVKAPVVPLARSRWGGWRSVLLKPPSSADGDES